MERNELFAKLGMPGGYVPQPMAFLEKLQLPPGMIQEAASNPEVHRAVEERYNQVLRPYDIRFKPEYDPRRAQLFEHVTDGIDSTIARQYGGKEDRQNFQAHTRNVTNIVECLMENAMAHDVTGRIKTPDMLRAEVLSERFMGPNVSPFGGLKDMMEDTFGPHASTNAVTAGAFTTLALGIVRRIYPRLLAFELASVQPMRLPSWKIFYQKFVRTTGGTALHTKADFDRNYADYAAEGAEPRQIDWDLESETVEAVDKALKFKISERLRQDVRAYWDLDVEAELQRAIEDEMVREIDKVLLRAMVLGATAGTVVYNTNPPSGSDVVNTMAHEKRLYDAIVDAEILVQEGVLRSPNWVIGSLTDVGRLKKREEFRIAQTPGIHQNVMQRHFLGTLQDRIRVYADPWWENEGTLLVGYKGDDLTETTAVHAPYIPLYVAPRIFYSNLTLSRSAFTSYANKIVNGAGLALISIVSS